MLKKILAIIHVIVTIWGFLSICAIIADFFGVLPYYEIDYRKKTDITPTVHLFPGQNVRLSADFARSVNPKDIKEIVWELKHSSGEAYTDLPHLKEVDLTLLPDFSGIVNVTVKATLYQEDKERVGEGSIYVVQTKPYKLDNREYAKTEAPLSPKKIDPSSIQVYDGSAKWRSVPAPGEEAGKEGLILSAGSTVWDDTAYFRFKLSDKPDEPYQYTATPVLVEFDQENRNKTGIEND